MSDLYLPTAQQLAALEFFKAMHKQLKFCKKSGLDACEAHEALSCAYRSVTAYLQQAAEAGE